MRFIRVLTELVDAAKWVIVAIIGGFIGAVAAFGELGIIFRWF